MHTSGFDSNIQHLSPTKGLGWLCYFVVNKAHHKSQTKKELTQLTSTAHVDKAWYLIPLTSIVVQNLLLKSIIHQWVTVWLIITNNISSYFESVPLTPSCCCKYWLERVNQLKIVPNKCTIYSCFQKKNPAVHSCCEKFESLFQKWNYALVCFFKDLRPGVWCLGPKQRLGPSWIIKKGDDKQ